LDDFIQKGKKGGRNKKTVGKRQNRKQGKTTGGNNKGNKVICQSFMDAYYSLKKLGNNPTFTRDEKERAQMKIVIETLESVVRGRGSNLKKAGKKKTKAKGGNQLFPPSS